MPSPYEHAALEKRVHSAQEEIVLLREQLALLRERVAVVESRQLTVPQYPQPVGVPGTGAPLFPPFTVTCMKEEHEQP
jgi:hypothetical protein